LPQPATSGQRKQEISTPLSTIFKKKPSRRATGTKIMILGRKKELADIPKGKHHWRERDSLKPSSKRVKIKGGRRGSSRSRPRIKRTGIYKKFKRSIWDIQLNVLEGREERVTLKNWADRR